MMQQKYGSYLYSLLASGLIGFAKIVKKISDLIGSLLCFGWDQSSLELLAEI